MSKQNLVCPNCKSTKIYKHSNEFICGICSYTWRNKPNNNRKMYLFIFIVGFKVSLSIMIGVFY